MNNSVTTAGAHNQQQQHDEYVVATSTITSSNHIHSEQCLDPHLNTSISHHILPHHQPCDCINNGGIDGNLVLSGGSTSVQQQQQYLQNNEKRTHVIAEFIAGSAGGLAGISVGYPLDTIKTRMQVFQKSHHEFNETFKTKWDYFKGLYRGLSSPLVGELASNFVLFGAFGMCKEWMSKYSIENRKENYQEWKENAAIFTSGAFSGLAISLVVGPTEMIKIQMQTSTGQEVNTSKQSISNCVKHLWKTRGFFHGYVACLNHQLTFYSAYFLIYELSKRKFAQFYNKNQDEKFEHNAFSLLISGGMAGTLAWALVYPTDSIQSIVRYDRNMNIRKALKQYTVRDLYRGFTTTVIRAFPVNSVTFYAYELAFNLMGGNR